MGDENHVGLFLPKCSASAPALCDLCMPLSILSMRRSSPLLGACVVLNPPEARLAAGCDDMGSGRSARRGWRPRWRGEWGDSEVREDEQGTAEEEEEEEGDDCTIVGLQSLGEPRAEGEQEVVVALVPEEDEG